MTDNTRASYRNKSYPISLTGVEVNLSERVDEQREELTKYTLEYEPVFDLDAFVSALEQIDAYSLSDFWYKRFSGGSYYCGILNLEPWCYVFDNEKYRLGTEEEVWSVLLKHHIRVDRDTWRVVFKWDSDSPLNGWLRTHSRDGDTASNVETLFSVAVNYVLDNSDRFDLWIWVESLYCPQCEIMTDTSILQEA